MKKIVSFFVFLLIFSTFLYAQPDTLTILHVNDSHSTLEAIGPRDTDLKGTLGGISRVATLVGMTKMIEPNVLFVHAGDISIGDVFFNKYFQVPELQILSSLGLDAMTLGNHEFDLSPDALLQSLQYVFPDPNNAFPLLSSNTDFTAVPDMQNYMKEYVIKQYGNAKVGIFGLTTPETALTSNPSPAVIETDPTIIATIAATMVQTLKNEGCNVIVLLSHMGFEGDKTIAANVPGINLIVGGHDHYKFEQPVTEIDPMGDTTWIVQAGSNYMYAGKTTLTFDGSNVELISYQLIPIDTNITQNEEVQAAVDGMIAEIESFYEIPFYTAQAGYATGFFSEEAANLLEDGSHCTAIGSLVTDAFREFTGTDIAIEAGGSTALPIWEGAFTPADLFRIVGYGFNTVNTLGFQLATYELTGADIWAGLEFGLSQIELNDEFFLQVSGMEYRYDATQPVGQRVVLITINGSPIDPSKNYSVTSNEMVLGILDYVGITPASEPEILVGHTEFESLMTYSINHENIITPITDCQRIISDLEEVSDKFLQFSYVLEQNYPNPFNPSTKISYSIPEASKVDLKVYDILGKEVATLVNETKVPGNYVVVFDASNLASGVYIYVLKSNNFVQTKKMILLR